MQATGILSSLALIVSALFPLRTQTLIHSIAGKAHIFFVGFFLTFSATVFLKHPSTWERLLAPPPTLCQLR
ncbi:MAG TPA: hypothetical protein VMT46_09340 [Anaerolineaceae bacterium]|nr:hypothetical protein [Anaerolineaceae bacterium]